MATSFGQRVRACAQVQSMPFARVHSLRAPLSGKRAYAATVIPRVASLAIPMSPCIQVISVDGSENGPKLHLEQPDAGCWMTWYTEELVKCLVGASSGTRRAQVTTVGVSSATVKRSHTRAEELEVGLQLEGRHYKEGDRVLTGEARLLVGKTEDGQDSVRLTSVKFSDGGSPLSHASAMDELEFAVTHTLGSAITERLNQLLWDVESSSRDFA